MELCRPHEKVGIKKVAFYLVNKVPMCGDCMNGVEIAAPRVDPLAKVNAPREDEQADPYPISTALMDAAKKETKVAKLNITLIKQDMAAGLDVNAVAKKYGATRTGVLYHLKKAGGVVVGKRSSRKAASTKPSSNGSITAVIVDLTKRRDDLTNAIEVLSKLEG